MKSSQKALAHRWKTLYKQGLSEAEVAVLLAAPGPLEFKYTFLARDDSGALVNQEFTRVGVVVGFAKSVVAPRDEDGHFDITTRYRIYLEDGTYVPYTKDLTYNLIAK